MELHAMTPQVPAELEALRATLQRYAEHATGAYAANTIKAWVSDGQVFVRWCQGQGHRPLPAHPATVAGFVRALGGARATATMRRYLASIAALHRAAQLTDPTQAPEVVLALRTLQREKAVAGEGRQRQAAPLNYTQIMTGLAAFGERPIDHFTRALVCVAFECLCRSEDLIRFDIEHLQVVDDGSGRLLIARGKTDQTGEGKQMYISATTVRLLNEWLACAPRHSGPLFRPVSKSGVVGETRISHMAVVRAMKRAARAAGLDDSGISSHSCRVGAAQDLLAAGFSLAEIMEAGRWKSERMPARYTENQAAARGGMAQFCRRNGR